MYEELKILIVSPENWGELRLSKHHFAASAASLGAQVHFLQPPSAGEKHLKLRSADAPGVQVITQAPLPKGLRFLPSVAKRNVEKRLLASIEKTAGYRFDIIWNFDRYQFRFLKPDDLDGRKMIFHLMDYPKDTEFEVQATTADLSIGVTEGLQKLLQENGAEDAIQIGHSFAPRPVKAISHPALISDRVKLACIGNMAIESIDLNALSEIAITYPDVDLFLIGPYGKSNLSSGKPASSARFEALIKEANVHWTGPVSWDTIPGWMARMDALIVAYDSVNHKKRASNSHKLLEYFSSGKEILCSYLDDLRSERELITMTSEGRPVSDGMKELLKKINGPDQHDDSSERQRIAFGRTYETSTKIILTKLLGQDSTLNDQ